MEGSRYFNNEQAAFAHIQLVFDHELGWTFESLMIVNVLLCGHGIDMTSHSLNLRDRAAGSYHCGNCRMSKAIRRFTSIVNPGRQKTFLHDPPDMSSRQKATICAGVQRTE